MPYMQKLKSSTAKVKAGMWVEYRISFGFSPLADSSYLRGMTLEHETRSGQVWSPAPLAAVWVVQSDGAADRVRIMDCVIVDAPAESELV